MNKALPHIEAALDAIENSVAPAVIVLNQKIDFAALRAFQTGKPSVQRWAGRRHVKRSNLNSFAGKFRCSVLAPTD